MPLRMDSEVKHDSKTFSSMTFLGLMSKFRVIRTIKFSQALLLISCGQIRTIPLKVTSF